MRQIETVGRAAVGDAPLLRGASAARDPHGRGGRRRAATRTLKEGGADALQAVLDARV